MTLLFRVPTSYSQWPEVGVNHRRLPDALILDFDLPLMNGPELCQRIRNKRPLRDAVVIMLSTSSEEADELISFTSGADDFITKPFNIRVLISRLEARERLRICYQFNFRIPRSRSTRFCRFSYGVQES